MSTLRKMWRSQRTWDNLRLQLSWFSAAIILDWLVVIVLNQISIYVEHTYPYKRDVEHYLGDKDISWPHALEERVSVKLLDGLAFWLPAGLTFLISAVRLSLHECHHGLLALMSSRAIMRITIEWIKNRVGRLRPDFLDRCQWDLVEKVCTGNPNLIKDGRRSFPSGHSATAWQGLFFLTLFMAGKNGSFAFGATFPRSSFLQSRILRFSIAVAPLFLAIWICITRLEDHYHHVEDVIAGSIIGILAALGPYLLYWPNPFDATELGVMDKAKLVYGAEETQQNSGVIELVGEEEGEGLLRGSGAEEV